LWWQFLAKCITASTFTPLAELISLWFFLASYLGISKIASKGSISSLQMNFFRESEKFWFWNWNDGPSRRRCMFTYPSELLQDNNDCFDQFSLWTAFDFFPRFMCYKEKVGPIPSSLQSILTKPSTELWTWHLEKPALTITFDSPV
jgi:hypothetical protein